MRIKKGIFTPCRSICEIDNGVCIGCGRTTEHLSMWRKYSSEQRENICAELADWEYNPNTLLTCNEI